MATAVATTPGKPSRTSGGLLGDGPSLSTLPVPIAATSAADADTTTLGSARFGRRAGGNDSPGENSSFASNNGIATSFDATNTRANLRSGSFNGTGTATSLGAGGPTVVASRGEPPGPRKADALESFIREKVPQVSPRKASPSVAALNKVDVAACDALDDFIVTSARGKRPSK
eukprot:CAMPEP_0174828882 /NCGR_PEP_ID=MMETSP1114-20130205/1585_1 /TAXON_ID=312471 /ORGANISM="Neobodo designis, Strain CCAP 1951/1" /LENGTH=172 /DNA_ID=CAMNT_0016062609 /DNA_START=171 /DNA_END=689 /DNA_ORIENTATION=-